MSNHLWSSFDLTTDFTAAAWSQFAAEGAPRTLILNGFIKKLPFYTRSSTLTLSSIHVITEFGTGRDSKTTGAAVKVCH